MQSLLYKAYPAWTRIAGGLKSRRLEMLKGLSPALKNPAGMRILEAGCANGKDFLVHMQGRGADLFGVDIEDLPMLAKCDFRVADIENLPFPDDYFDVVVSFGVLEHIAPMAKLDRCINEINRVGKSYVVIVPSIGTVIEPHTAVPVWQLRSNSRKTKSAFPLNYFSDEAWLSFDGFSGASIRSYWYLPGLIKNTVIHKMANEVT